MPSFMLIPVENVWVASHKHAWAWNESSRTMLAATYPWITLNSSASAFRIQAENTPASSANALSVGNCLQHALFCQGQSAAGRDDKMVEKAYIHQGQCLAKVLRQGEIRLAGFGHTGRMIMRQNEGSSMMAQGGFYDFARVYRRLAQRSAGHFLADNEAKAGVQIQGHTVFNGEVTEQGYAIAFHAGGLIQGFAHAQFFFQRTAAQFTDGQDLAGLGLPQAGKFQK